MGILSGAVHLMVDVRQTGTGLTMPLLAGVPVTHQPVIWTDVSIWRIADGKIAEHWACRDDVGLLRQVGAWPPK